MPRVVNVVGARPNFMKIAPLYAEYGKRGDVDAMLVHTGQHYDRMMSQVFFNELGLPEPDVYLGVGSGSHAVQTAEIMKKVEPVLLEHRPDIMVVVGDVNSTIACGLVAVKLGIRLAHIEAGLRSGDHRMPEEINRILTDAISDLLFCTEQSGVDNLVREGVAREKIHLVGNVMIDTLLANLSKAESSTILQDLHEQGHMNGGDYAVLTFHRPSNVESPAVLQRLLDGLDVIQRDMPIVFPVHPRTRRNLEDNILSHRIRSMTNLVLAEPLAYLDFLHLMARARLVLTDSGGIQEETTVLQIPCLTLRENTERPVTVERGSNELVGTDPARIAEAYNRIKKGCWKTGQIPPLWDGRAAERIVDILVKSL
jgi:UDP-N-acetylglucosamine 2-epimerase (non-hydrolysing)